MVNAAFNKWGLKGRVLKTQAPMKEEPLMPSLDTADLQSGTAKEGRNL